MATSLNFRRLLKAPLLLLLLVVIAALARFVGLGYVPAGADGDSAWVALDGLDWVDRGALPYFLDAAYTPEPLMIFLDGLFIRIAGISHVTPRLVTAANGVIMVILAYLATWWLIGPDQSGRLRKRASILAAAATTFGLHIIHLSRQGLRAPLLISVLLLITWLTAYAWWRGGYWRWILAGTALSLTQYTYISGRVAPATVILWFLHSWWVDPALFRKRLKGWMLMALTALVLVLPNLITYAITPEALMGRVDVASGATGGFIWNFDLTRYGGFWGLIGQKLLANLPIVGLHWDGAYTAMEQPILAPVFFAGAIIALSLGLARRRRTVAFGWALLGLPVMLLPDIISGTVIAPHAMRQVGTVAFWVILAGLGTAAAWEWFDNRLAGRPKLRQTMTALLTLAVIVPSSVQYYRYMALYTPDIYADPDTYWRIEQADLDLATAVTNEPEKSYLIPYHEYTRWNIAWLTARGFRYRHSPITANGLLSISDPPHEITIITTSDPHRARHDGQSTAVDTRLWILLHQGQSLLLPPLTSEQEAAVLDIVETVTSEPLLDRAGTRIADFYTAGTPDGLLAERNVVDYPLDAVFLSPDRSEQPELRLAGYTLADQNLTPGRTIFATLFWEVLKPPSESYEFFAQIWTDDGQSIAGAHGLPYNGTYRTRVWLPGEIVATHHRLDIPPSLGVGRYSLAAGIYRQLHNEPLEVNGANAAVNKTLALAPDLRIAPAPPDYTGFPPPQTFQFDSLFEIENLRFTLDGTAIPYSDSLEATAGQVLVIDIVWQVLQRPDRDYSVFLHLDVVQGEPPAAQTDILMGGGFPTGAWRPGDRISDSLALNLDDGIAAGLYDLYLGIYFWQTGERVGATVNGSASPDSRIRLGQISIN